MSEMEEKLGAILSNPQMMQQIMALAQSMGQEQKTPHPKNDNPSLPELDPSMLQKIGAITRQSSMDQNQQTLLRALSPYLSRERVNKLEKAMRAAKMARAASMFINAGGLQMLSGR